MKVIGISPPVFTLGNEIEPSRDRFWLIDGNPNLATIPGGLLTQYQERPVPIRLPHGDSKYGAAHILRKHGHWVKKHQPDSCVATLVHRKLSQPGRLFTAEAVNKLTLSMRMSPDAFMVLRMMEDFLSITTLYLRQRPLEGEEIARYLGHLWAHKPVKPRPL